MAWAGKDLSSRRGFDHEARIHHHDPLRHACHDPEIVTDQQDGRSALGGELVKQLEHLGLYRDIEGCSRLVGDQECRPKRQRDRNEDALAHSAAELVRVAIQLIAWPRDADGAQKLCRAVSRLAPSHVLVGPEGLDNLLADRQNRVKPAHWVLRDERYLLPSEAAHLAVAQPDQVTVAEPDLAGDNLRRGTWQEAKDGQARHAFARTGLPDEAESPPACRSKLTPLTACTTTLRPLSKRTVRSRTRSIGSLVASCAWPSRLTPAPRRGSLEDVDRSNHGDRRRAG